MNKIVAFKLIDGSIIENEEQARIIENNLLFKSDLLKLVENSDCTSSEKESIFDFIVEHQDSIYSIFEDYR